MSKGKLREFRVSGILEGPDHPTGSGRGVSFLVTATSKEEVTKRMKEYKWIFWQGEDLEETERLRLAQGEIAADGEVIVPPEIHTHSFPIGMIKPEWILEFFEKDLATTDVWVTVVSTIEDLHVDGSFSPRDMAKFLNKKIEEKK